jgi:hypothetical protein
MKPLKTTLEMDDEIGLHEKGWIAQRIGWCALALILVAASIGVFGDGIVSKRFESKNNIEIKYQHFGRYEAAFELRIAATVDTHGLLVAVPQSYLAAMEVDKIIPQPGVQKIENDQLILMFDANHRAEITVYLIPKTTGKVSGDIAVNATRFSITHFIYP